MKGRNVHSGYFAFGHDYYSTSRLTTTSIPNYFLESFKKYRPDYFYLAILLKTQLGAPSTTGNNYQIVGVNNSGSVKEGN